MNGVKTIKKLTFTKGAEIQNQISQMDTKHVIDAFTQTSSLDLQVGVQSATNSGDLLYITAYGAYGNKGPYTAIAHDVSHMNLTGVKPEIANNITQAFTEALPKINDVLPAMAESIRNNQEVMFYNKHLTVFDVPSAKLKLSDVIIKVFSTLAEYLSNASHDLLQTILQAILDNPLNCSLAVFGGICKFSARFCDFGPLFRLIALGTKPVLVKQYLVKLFKSALTYGTAKYTKITMVKCLGYSFIPCLALYALAHPDETVEFLQQILHHLGIDTNAEFTLFVKKIFFALCAGGSTIGISFSSDTITAFHMKELVELNWEVLMQGKSMSCWDRTKFIYHSSMAGVQHKFPYTLQHPVDGANYLPRVEEIN